MVSSELLCRMQTRPGPSSIFAEKDHHFKHARSHVVAAPRPRITGWSMDSLSTELIALILSHLREIDARSLTAVRLVSRRLCAVSTPIKYERLRLTKSIVAPDANVYMTDALNDVFSHARHVEVLDELEPEHVRCFLARATNLKSIRWKYRDQHLCSGGYWLPSDVLKSTSQSRSRLRLAIEDLPLDQYTGSNNDVYLQAIPAPLLVSLQAECRFPLRTPQLDSLKRLLIASKGLEKLHYNDRGQGTRFSFLVGERMPPLHELELRSYDWDHTAAEARAHWDFSQLQKLVLVDVPLNKFLSSVPASALEQVKHLECGEFNPGTPEVRRATTAALASLIVQIRELDELMITCHTTQVPIDVLLAHGQSLRSLRFRDHVGFNEDDVSCPTMSVKDLGRLSRGMTRLESIELDWDVKQNPEGPLEFLSVLCRFPHLKDLTLHVQTLIDPFEEDVDMDGDKDMAAAGEMFKHLIREAEQHYGQTGRGDRLKWERITINVGGWRPVQMRRLSAAWRERNRLGIYAERCFVFERLPPTAIAEYNMYEKANIRE